jgi:hypothetical protein
MRILGIDTGRRRFGWRSSRSRGLTNNAAERSLRGVAFNGKNALFAGHDEGGKTSGRIASLIETCKINGVEFFAWTR